MTDCRPLEVVFNNANSKPKARIERWRLRLQGYDFNVTYKQGNKNIAYYISRHVSISNDTKHSEYAEEYVKFVSENAVPKCMTLDEYVKVQIRTQCYKMLLNVWNQESGTNLKMTRQWIYFLDYEKK